MNPRRVPRITSGQRVSALRRPLNRIVDAVNNLATPVTVGTAARVLPQQVILVEVRLFNFGPPTTITCTDPGEQLNPSARTYEVVLPPTFDPVTRAGVSYVYSDINNRVADGTETQQLTPEYLLQDFLYVVWNAGGNGSYVDLNMDGRQWAKVP